MSNSVLGFFGKHFVPLVFIFEFDGQIETMLVSGFIMGVEDRHYLVTAGHCLREVQKLEEQGARIIECYLADGLGQKAKDALGVPFDYDHNSTIWLDEEGVYDCGIVFLHPHYIRLLKANGIEALDEQYWSLDLDFEHLALIGTPANRVNQYLNRVECEPTFYPIYFVNTDDVDPIILDRIGNSILGRILLRSAPDVGVRAFLLHA